MSKLAILGHKKHGKRVIEILEMLGGDNSYYNLHGTDDEFYFINSNGYIDEDPEIFDGKFIFFTLEEFLEKFPYNVGDKVIYGTPTDVGHITSMKWDGEKITYSLRLRDGIETDDWGVWELQPYNKQETMEEKPLIATPTEKEGYYQITKEQIEAPKISITAKETEILFDKHVTVNKVELILGDDFEVKQEDGKWFVVKKQPQYPKTYEECCKVLDIETDVQILINYRKAGPLQPYEEYNKELFTNLYKLKVCRDAYWKIAGDWQPNWEDELWVDMYYISYDGVSLAKETGFPCCNMLLIFSTEEMRDSFYKNFKELIEECKELL